MALVFARILCAAILLFVIILAVSGCESIPIRAKVCAVQNGQRVCVGIEDGKAVIEGEIDFKKTVELK